MIKKFASMALPLVAAAALLYPAVVADDRLTLTTLIPLDVSHLLIGLGVAALWRGAGQPTHLWVDRRSGACRETNRGIPFVLDDRK